MSIYNYERLFAEEEEAVEVYCLPKRLIGYVAESADRSRVAYSDVVIEALLHYFSDRIAGDLDRAVSGKATHGAACEDAVSSGKMTDGNDPLSIAKLRNEFCHHFLNSFERLAARLQVEERHSCEKGPQRMVDQKDHEIATLKLLLEKSNRQISQLMTPN